MYFMKKSKSKKIQKKTNKKNQELGQTKNSAKLVLFLFGLGPIIGIIIIKIFNLSGYAAGVLLIQSSMPSAILTYLIASMYSPKKIVDNISSMIVVSTLMSLITVPIVVFLSLKFFS